VGHLLHRQRPGRSSSGGAESGGEELADILTEFARTMLTEFPIQGILDHLVRRIVDVVPISGAGVTLISATGAPRYITASDPSARRYEELQSELGEGPCMGAFRNDRAVSVPDLNADTTFTSFAPRALELGLAAVFTFPLRQGHTRLGALDLYRDQPGGLSESEMTTAQTLADVTSAYLVNAQRRAELEASSARSHERSVHDALTGLPNRTLLLERIEHAIVRSGRSKKIVAILFIDLDDFKLVNDVHGHKVGDQLLVAVCERMAVSLRPGDTLARLSGDEFVVLCEELDDVAQVEIVASRIVECLEDPFVLGGVEITVSASVGIAFAGQSHHDGEELLQTADLAMYQVKRSGGANHQVIDVHGQHLEEYQSGIQTALGKAIQRQELRIEYQPIVSIGDGQIAGAEALIRWDHPVRGLINPGALIPLAERCGMIGEVGRWVFERSCMDRKRWDGYRGAFTLAVNMSAHQIMAPEFVAMIATTLADTDTDPSQITLEITEGALIRDSRRAHIVLDGLKELGLTLALDDFGTGYSSLSYLKQFPIDIVKIDQSFVTDIDRDESSHAIVSKSVELAHLLGLTVTSEGVETVAQYLALAELGSDYCQGYYFARPLAPEQLDALVSSMN
jgi:diguanylate cyclase (GGDEF)-like protein